MMPSLRSVSILLRRGNWLKITLLTALLLFLAVGSAGAFFAWEINQPKGTGQKKEIIFEKGASAREIADRLSSAGLINCANCFVAYVKLAGLEDQIQAGSYDIPPTLSIREIAEVLRHGTFDIRLTFLEGWRREEYLDYALSRLPVDSASFSEEFLAATQGGEGYLFPDTYLVPQNITARDLVALLKANFEKKWAPLAAAVGSQNLTQKEAVTLASIVQREAGTAEDAKIIAGIFIKRFKIGDKLDSDVTVQYALGFQENTGTWWKKSELTALDLNIDSPYNTRRYQGLPPGPICSPGLTALSAVAYPTSTDYLYFLYDKDGNVHYATTLAEHNANVAKYLH